MPNPNDYKTKDAFVRECIIVRQQEDPEEKPVEFIAICNSIWNNRNKQNRGHNYETGMDR